MIWTPFCPLLTLTSSFFSIFPPPTLISSLTHTSYDRVLVSHTYLFSDSYLSWPCTCISCLSSFWLISLMTVYLYLTLIFLLTHSSHDCVLSLTIAPLWLMATPISEMYIKNQLLVVNTQLSLTQIYLSIWSSPSWNLCLDISKLLRYTLVLHPHCL